MIGSERPRPPVFRLVHGQPTGQSAMMTGRAGRPRKRPRSSSTWVRLRQADRQTGRHPCFFLRLEHWQYQQAGLPLCPRQHARSLARWRSPLPLFPSHRFRRKAPMGARVCPPAAAAPLAGRAKAKRRPAFRAAHRRCSPSSPPALPPSPLWIRREEAGVVVVVVVVIQPVIVTCNGSRADIAVGLALSLGHCRCVRLFVAVICSSIHFSSHSLHPPPPPPLLHLLVVVVQRLSIDTRRHTGRPVIVTVFVIIPSQEFPLCEEQNRGPEFGRS